MSNEIHGHLVFCGSAKESMGTFGVFLIPRKAPCITKPEFISRIRRTFKKEYKIYATKDGVMTIVRRTFPMYIQDHEISKLKKILKYDFNIHLTELELPNQELIEKVLKPTN